MNIKLSPKAARWVRLFVDYTGLAAFLVTIAITGSAIAASWAVVVGSLAGLAAGLILEKRLAPMPLVTAVIGELFGGATILFHNDRIIKMKPTILYAGFGLFLLGGMVRGKNPLKALMGEAFHLPDAVVRTLTLRYALFFFLLAAANEVVWRTQSTRIWGFYKFPGTALLIFLFALTQAPLMMKHADTESPQAKGD
jgi:intracellular septation protein